MAKHFRKTTGDVGPPPPAAAPAAKSGGAATVAETPGRKLVLIKPLRLIRSTTIAAI